MINDRQSPLPWLADTQDVSLSRTDVGIAIAGMVIAARRLGISPAPESRDAGLRVEAALAELVRAVAVHDLQTFLWGPTRCAPPPQENGKASPPPVPVKQEQAEKEAASS